MLSTKEIALIISFAALTISLDPIRIPSVILPGVYFRFCEIPIVIAFLLFGFKIGISIAALNVFAEMILFPGPVVFIGRPMVFLLVTCMLVGIFLADKLLRSTKSNSLSKRTIYYTAFGVGLRAAAAPFLNFALYRYALPIFAGLKMTDTAVIALVPGFIVYAIIFTAYTIPIGLLISRMISRNLKITPRF